MTRNSSKAATLHLRRPRAIVRAIVVIGVTASIAANVLGAEDLIAAGISGWPPVALLLSLEVLTRVPASKRLGAAGRVVATIGVAFAAGWLSYWHMAATVSQHGEVGGSQYIWPLSVDGLMTISAIALVELGARIRAIESQGAALSAAPLIEAVERAVAPAIEAIPDGASRAYWGARLKDPSKMKEVAPHEA